MWQQGQVFKLKAKGVDGQPPSSQRSSTRLQPPSRPSTRWPRRDSPRWVSPFEAGWIRWTPQRPKR